MAAPQTTQKNLSKATGTSKPSTSAPTDRFAILQKKLDDLQRVHADGKREHQTELERAKFDIARAQKSSADHSDRYEKLKKQNDQLESRYAELKKQMQVEQSEMRDLRVKLKISEQERDRLLSTESSKKNQETKRREDMKGRDRQLLELQSQLKAEKRKRESLEEKLAATQKGIDAISAISRDAEQEAARLKSDADEAKQTLAAFSQQSTERESTLTSQLEQCRHLLSNAATEYARLLENHRATLSQLRNQNTSLELKLLRAERKLANAEGQVVELAHLIRSTNEAAILNEAWALDAEAQAAFYAQAWQDERNFPKPDDLSDDALSSKLFALYLQHMMDDAEPKSQRISILEALLWRNKWNCDQTMMSHVVVDQQLVLAHRELGAEQKARTEDNAQHDAEKNALQLAREQAALQHERDLEEAGAAGRELEKIMKKLKEDHRKELDKNASVITMHHSAEEALKSEIDQLQNELVEVSRFQEAYYSLSNEVNALLARNALAENEAKRLSSFNAEILGHQNPAQRILYVDRIRKELAEAKQNLVVSKQVHEDLIWECDTLKQELAMYKSVAVPFEGKPRTTITRVTRPPLASQSLNKPSGSNSVSTQGASLTRISPEENGARSRRPTTNSLAHLSEATDMTIDEIS